MGWAQRGPRGHAGWKGPLHDRAPRPDRPPPAPSCPPGLSPRPLPVPPQRQQLPGCGAAPWIPPAGPIDSCGLFLGQITGSGAGEQRQGNLRGDSGHGPRTRHPPRVTSGDQQRGRGALRVLLFAAPLGTAGLGECTACPAVSCGESARSVGHRGALWGTVGFRGALWGSVGFCGAGWPLPIGCWVGSCRPRPSTWQAVGHAQME